MARRRVTVRRSRSGGQRRKLNWQNGFLACRDFTLTNNFNTLTGWFKWPSGLRNEGGGGFSSQEIVPVDETLVKTIVSANVTLDLFGVTQSAANVVCCFGLIAWDAGPQSAGDLDGALVDPLVVPNPAADGTAEWIIRLPFCFTRDNFSIGNIASEFISSRAMRKLPPRTGILGVLGVNMPLDNSTDNCDIDATIDVRMLFKSGAYVA